MNCLKLTLSILTAVILIGCGSPILPGNDPIVVRAQETDKLAFTAFEAFEKIETSNAEFLWSVSHEFKHVADAIRAQKKVWFNTLEAALAIYKSDRSAINRTLLENSITQMEAQKNASEASLAEAVAKGAKP